MSFSTALKQVSIATTKNQTKLSIVLLGSAIALTCASPANAFTITMGGNTVAGKGEFSSVHGAKTIDFESGVPASGFAVYSLPQQKAGIVSDLNQTIPYSYYDWYSPSGYNDSLWDDNNSQYLRVTNNSSWWDANNSTVISFEQPIDYFGLDWKKTNPIGNGRISFFNDNKLIAEFESRDVFLRTLMNVSPEVQQANSFDYSGFIPDRYINFFADFYESFNKVVLSSSYSTGNAFDSDNHAYRVANSTSTSPSFSQPNSTDGLPTTTVSLNVPGTANPWFAGIADDPQYSSSNLNKQAPILVEGLSLTPGSAISINASGWGGLCEECNWGQGPDGLTSSPPNSPFNGISGTNAPMASLVGVFLGEESPLLLPKPRDLYFINQPFAPTEPYLTSLPSSVPQLYSMDYLTISPELKQVFFIGDGRTSSGAQQQIVVPTDATRFYLGMIDFMHMNDNNGGSFDVQIIGNAANNDRTSVPEPSSIIGLFALSLLGINSLLKRKQQISHA